MEISRKFRHMLHRLVKPLEAQSFFLFGARGTGKTYLLEHLFNDKEVLTINLLEEREFLTFSRNPERLRERIEQRSLDLPEWVVIDEIQRIPALLNEVHSLIESPELRGRLKFALTGSSARKLKRGGANLLAGRALLNYLYPLTHLEWPDNFTIDDAISWGGLPRVVLAESVDERIELLDAYVTTYIKEEIRIEQVVRNLDPFLRFIDVAAQMNGEILNYSAIGRDCRTDPRMVERYYQILEDTLLGIFIEPFHRSIRKRQLQKPKFLFFDMGVVAALKKSLNVPPRSSTSLYGKQFEQFITLEIYRINSYLRKRYSLFFYATHDGAEIDLVIERPGGALTAIEIKSSSEVSAVEIGKLSKFGKEIGATELMVLSQERTARKINDVTVYPWEQGIAALFAA